MHFSHIGHVGTLTKKGPMLNHFTSATELMAHPYLELTNLDRLLEGGVIDQKQATTDYPLVHSSKDHVAICPEVGNISGELMYLHAAVTDNGKVNVSLGVGGLSFAGVINCSFFIVLPWPVIINNRLINMLGRGRK